MIHFFKLFILILLLFFALAEIAVATVCSGDKEGFRDNKKIGEYLQKDLMNFSGYASYKSLGKTYGTNGTDGKEIHAILISEHADWTNKTKPTIVVTGAIHANEWATPEVAIGIAEYLLENRLSDKPVLDYKGNPIIGHKFKDPVTGNETYIPEGATVKELLRKVQIVVIPVLNPDGYDYSNTPEVITPKIVGTSGNYTTYYTEFGWRPNHRNFEHDALLGDEICYDDNKKRITDATILNSKDRCYLADREILEKYVDIYTKVKVVEEYVVVCEDSINSRKNNKTPYLTFISEYSDEDGWYEIIDPTENRMFCTSNKVRIWKDEWYSSQIETVEGSKVELSMAQQDGYADEYAQGVDLNRNFPFKWDSPTDANFIRIVSPSSRIYRGPEANSEKEVQIMMDLVKQKNVKALIDYHSGSTQVLYPFAYTDKEEINGHAMRGRSWDKDDDVFKAITERMTNLINKALGSSGTYTFHHNFNGSNTGSGVARDWYYNEKKITAVNVEVGYRLFIMDDNIFKSKVPDICRTQIPGALWLMFWAADNNFSQPAKDFYREQKPAPKSTP